MPTVSFSYLLAPFVLTLALLGSGCGSIISGLSSDLSAAILNQDDPELVKDALPSYLLLLDSFAVGNPDNPEVLSAAAQLYAAYGAALVDDPERARSLTIKARYYGKSALCAANKKTCELQGIAFDEYVERIQATKKGDMEALYSYSLSTLAWIRSNSDDLNALAELPKVEVALAQVMTLEPGDYEASVCMYLGILNTLRPPALGGDPEAGREWFEKGIALSEGQDLSIKVEYARGYARLLYERELHDRLLNEVLAADVKQPDQILFNVLAQQQAEALLASADDYF
ncbi:MAG: TRAP transporter TatT component family protein [Gammaproteobacteria bacterium]